jgi:hypothetical protein
MFRFNTEYKIRLSANESPILNVVGILRLPRIGSVSKIAATLRNIRRNVWTWASETLKFAISHS